MRMDFEILKDIEYENENWLFLKALEINADLNHHSWLGVLFVERFRPELRLFIFCKKSLFVGYLP